VDKAGNASPVVVRTVVVLERENHPPVFTSFDGNATGYALTPEGWRFSRTFTATDPDAEVLVYSISGGADAREFSINAATGELRMIGFPDYENPRDFEGDNQYEVTVTVTDVRGGSDAQTLLATVKNDPVDDPLPTGDVTVTVLDPEGNPAKGAELVARTGDLLSWLEAKTGDDGTHVFSGLSPVEWVFTAFPAEDDANFTVARESLPVSVTVVAGSTKPVALLLRNANLTGRVLFLGDFEHEPVEKAQVWAFPDENFDGIADQSAGADREGIMETDARGFFSFMLPPGNYILHVEPPNGYPKPHLPTRFSILPSQTDPVEVEIVLSEILHTVVGFVRDQHNRPVNDGQVVFLGDSEQGWRSIDTGESGNFFIELPGGSWDVRILPHSSSSADWSGEGAQQVLHLPDTGESTWETLDLRVERRTDWGKVVGRVLMPNGSSDWGDYASEVFVEVHDSESVADWVEIDANGSFEFKLDPGSYQVKVGAGSVLGYASPEPRVANVSEGFTYDLGDIRLLERSATIDGNLADEDGNGLPNFFVYAVNGNGGMVSGQTNATGNFKLSVMPGNWSVAYDVPMPLNGSPSPYMAGDPEEVYLESNQTIEVSLVVSKATRLLTGTLVTPDGNLVTSLKTWVYGRSAAEGAGEYGFVAEAYVDGLGRFEIRLPDGEFLVGAWLPDSADYSMKNETRVGAEDTEVQIVLYPHDAKVTGRFTFDGAPINANGFYAQIFAFNLSDPESFKSAAMAPDATFELMLEEGLWQVGYHVFNQAGLPNPVVKMGKPIEVNATIGGSAEVIFPLKKIEGILRVRVLDDSNVSITQGIAPWAQQVSGRGAYNVKIPQEGDAFQVSAPINMNLQVGADVSPELSEKGYFVTLEKAVKLRRIDEVEIVTLRLVAPPPDEFIEGTVLDDKGDHLEGAFVWAWSVDGQSKEVYSGEFGYFRFDVMAGDVWHVGADYRHNLTNKNVINPVPLEVEREEVIDLTFTPSVNVELSLHPVLLEKMPALESEGFDPSIDFTKTLDDGTKIFIPANSFMKRSGRRSFKWEQEDEVRITVVPFTSGMPRKSNNKPLSYGYDITFTDSNGSDVGSMPSLSRSKEKLARISIPFSQEELDASQASASDLKLSFYSTFTSPPQWVEAQKVTVSDGYVHGWVDHFSKWAITVAPPEVRPSTVPNVMSKGLTEKKFGERWFESSWLGTFHDAGSGWIYHGDHGWLYSADDGAGNYWLYHANLGWLWTGPNFYGNAQGHRFLFSQSLDSWLFFDSNAKNFFVYKDASRMNHLGAVLE
jgi:hypothetical protein